MLSTLKGISNSALTKHVHFPKSTNELIFITKLKRVKECV